MYGLTPTRIEELNHLVAETLAMNTWEKLYERAENLRVQAEKLNELGEFKAASKLLRKASDYDFRGMRKERLSEQRGRK